MQHAAIDVAPFTPSRLHNVLSLALRAWGPVFSAMQRELPSYIYKAFYPHGWEQRQREDIASICRDEQTDVWLAVSGEKVVGFVALRTHREDSMGEIHAIAVDPEFQRLGVGSRLLEFSLSLMRERGLAMAMVETGGDSGHAPSRAVYEQAGFTQRRVARYFQQL